MWKVFNFFYKKKTRVYAMKKQELKHLYGLGVFPVCGLWKGK